MCLLLRSGSRWRLYHRPDWWSAAEMVSLLEVSPIPTEELWSSVRVTFGSLVTSMTKALLPRLLSMAGRTALGRVMEEATVFLVTFNAADNFWYPFPDLCQHNPV